jgi:hypothetical protein
MAFEVVYYVQGYTSKLAIKIPTVEVQNNNGISCCNSSLVECPTAVQAVGARFKPGRAMSVSGALLNDRDDLGQVSSILLIFFLNSRQV